MSKSSAETSTQKTTGDKQYLEYEMLEDNTLAVTVPYGTNVQRVLVMEEGTHWGGMYYVD